MKSNYILTDGKRYVQGMLTCDRERAIEFTFDEIRALMSSDKEYLQWIKEFMAVEVSGDGE